MLSKQKLTINGIIDNLHIFEITTIEAWYIEVGLVRSNVR